MLKIIEPKSHHLHQATIDSFLHLLRHHHEVSFSPEILKKATFVIAHCKTFSPSDKASGREIYGGAIFYPQQISHFINLFVSDQAEVTLGKLFSAFHPNGHTYWLARVGLFRDHDLSVPLLEKLDCRHKFYQQLYKAFLKFGKTKKVKIVAFALRISDIFDINTYKHWPSLLEVKLPDSSHGYFYGLLSLKKRAHTPRKRENTFESFQPFSEGNHSPLNHSDADGNDDAKGRTL